MKEKILDQNNLNLPNNIKNKAIKSLKWSFLNEFIASLFPPIVTLILARLLIPSDFGIIAIATIFISLAKLFQDFGLAKALIQRDKDVKESANVVFWGNFILSFLIFLTLFFIAPIIADIFREARVIFVLRVLSLQIIFVSLSSVQIALFQREFYFKKIFFNRLISSFVPGFVSIPLAFLNFGVWAIVLGSLAGSFIQMVFFWFTSSWRPNMSFDKILARQLFGFGGWILLETFFAWLIVQGESMAVGYFLDIKELGIYQMGATFVLLVFGTVFNSIIPILYSTFSRLQKYDKELREYFLKITKLVSALSLPMGMGLTIISVPFSAIVFNEKWSGIAQVILILSLVQSVSWLICANSGVMRAIGRPDINSKLLGFFVVISVPIYIVSAPFGIFTFCLARLGLETVYVFLNFIVVKKVLKISFQPFQLIGYAKIIIAVLLMGSVAHALVVLFSPFEGIASLYKIFIITFTGAISYIGFLYLFDRSIINQSKELLITALKR
ncbi:MAG: hypothetical protein A2312_04700 [Candidatus Staskawiczbacteria bacterium RIFOXYB2_FULL_32_9]|uniref:Uncharacterized protein n=1 Tax=Candidatus Staskawiczbacteria bacterium RIFOXYD1_FULL_32_13 TaxID=1802234 RepID=A0A1G2JQ92_9BACT|nr:MAG: Polysaccharide biosynthesis protein [Parcubacteria group bacterium GW2011_GWC2_32_10]OGZ78556.1 MAG: hypothetical protein A2256_02690 [Candidatus Staskawiczbacteria bacterium RIFOXYA2_FULL_32_7]OGZ79181.1 MAG: hypothetical protein A2360_03985 [Candidatus Staskawiczbacteria bacterium RIFOXYB1_FULL_32_11]OGZ81233.1 MAG: hypothetical protein A2312_04700 [Candidatus Staskawiczbacteria bacterium RIFOXYB2_FULL_32_9]OGZ88395.1 MAG: hypothetical protein A2463_00560 [Candidatus Staskawiczbacteri